MRNKFGNFLFLSAGVIAAVFLCSCATAPERLPDDAPQWLIDFKAGKTPITADGLEGIGIGVYKRGDRNDFKIARDTAYNDAIQKLSNHMEIKVKSVVTSYLEDKYKQIGKKTEEVSTERIESLIKVIIDQVLGYKHFGEYDFERGGECYVFVWMTKEEADRVTREEIAKKERVAQLKLKSSMEIYSAAESLLSAGDLVPAIPQYVSALKPLADIPVITEYNGTDNLSFKAKIENRITYALTGVKARVESQPKEVIVGREARTPVVVRCWLPVEGKDTPIRNLPLKCALIQGEGRIDPSMRTDESGIAKCRIYGMKTPNKTNIIRIENNAEELERIDSLFSCLSLKENCTFSAVSSIEGYKIVVRILEEQLGRAVSGSALASQISDSLTGKGYRIVDSSRANLAIANIDVVSILAGQMSCLGSIDLDKVNTLIIGTAKTEYQGDTMPLNGKVFTYLPCSIASVSIKVLNLENGQEIASKTDSGIKGWEKTRESASEDALKRAAEELAAYICLQLK